MADMTNGQHLHDRATRGFTLTAQEQSALAEWYRCQDDQEQQEVGNQLRPEVLFQLKGEIHVAVKELRNLAERIDQLTTENSRLSGEVKALEKSLIPQIAAHRA